MKKVFDSGKKAYNSVLQSAKNHPWRTFLLIVVICVSFVLKMNELNNGTMHEFPGSDPYASHQNAVEVLNGEKPINTYLNPFVTVYLVVVYFFFGESMWIAKFIQILASFIIPFFVYYFVKKYFGDTAGFIGALLSLIHPFIIFYSAHLWSEFWIIFMFFALLYVFVKSLESRKGILKNAFIIGLITSVASMGKIWMGLIGGILTLFILIHYYEKNNFMKFVFDFLKIGGLALLGIVIILVPWIIYASSSAGFFVFINMNSQTNLYIGNNPEGEIAFTSRPYYGYEYTYSTNVKDGNCGDLLKNTSGTVTTTLYEKSIRKCAGKYASNYILDNPGKFISKMKTFTFKYWLFPNLEFYQRYIKTPKLLIFTLWTFWVLALIGFLVSLSKFRMFLPYYIILFVIWFFSGMAFYLARYKVGLVPIVLLFASGGIYTIGYFLSHSGSKKK